VRAVREVIAIVSGNDRSAAFLRGIKGGIIWLLVIDEADAAALLAFAPTFLSKPLKKKIKT